MRRFGSTATWAVFLALSGALAASAGPIADRIRSRNQERAKSLYPPATYWAPLLYKHHTMKQTPPGGRYLYSRDPVGPGPEFGTPTDSPRVGSLLTDLDPTATLNPNSK